MEKMIKCKSCGGDIASSAKICPNCGAKNSKPFYKKWWVWVIAAVLVIAVGSSLGGGSDSEPTKKSSEQAKETSYNIGDTLSTDKFEITVTSVNTAKKVGSEYFSEEPSEGGIYVIVNWECKNISDSPVSSFSCPSIYLKDKNGTQYDSEVSATSYYATEVDLDRKILSDLNPGINVKDAQVFEVSEEAYNAGGFSVFVDADKDFSIGIN